MHGSLGLMKDLAKKGADVHGLEKSSGRTALHKAAFWGHDGAVDYLVNECKVNVNAVDYNGDTALNDATRFGHKRVVEILVAAKADKSVKNKEGKDAAALAVQYEQPQLASLVGAAGQCPRSKL